MSLDLIVEVDAQTTMPEEYQPSSIEQLVRAALERESADGRWEVTVVFSTDAHLQDLHRDFLADDSPTDIMTFPYGAEDDTWIDSDAHGGDIVISVDRAREQAADGDWDTWSELQFLVVHGVLHLCGWDDATPELRQAMHARQHEILRHIQDC